MSELTEVQLAVIGRIEKLFRLAANNTSEAESSSALAKAQEMLDAYQISSSSLNVSGHAMGPTKREDKRFDGGLYKWQRDLWRCVAGVNMCVYWSFEGKAKGQKYEHRVLGGQMNVVSTEMMASYLQHAIERLAREYAKAQSMNVFCRDAIAYREGMAARLMQRLEARQKEQKAQAEADRASKSTGTNALVLASISEQEREANDDYLYGEGYSARRKERAAAEAARQAKATADLKQWEDEHPEEAEAKRQSGRDWWNNYLEEQAKKRDRMTPKQKEAQEKKEKAAMARAIAKQWKPRSSSYYTGHADGGDVSLDKQMDAEKRTALK